MAGLQEGVEDGGGVNWKKGEHRIRYGDGPTRPERVEKRRRECEEIGSRRAWEIRRAQAKRSRTRPARTQVSRDQLIANAIRVLPPSFRPCDRVAYAYLLQGATVLDVARRLNMDVRAVERVQAEVQR